MRLFPLLLATFMATATLVAGCARREPERAAEPDAPAMPASTAAAPAPTPPAAATMVSSSGLPRRLTALGNEPFWAAEVDGDGLVYKTPENPGGTQVAITRQVVGETTLLSGNLGGASLILTVRAARCSDGMSDRSYPYAVARAIGGEVAQGCAKTD